VCSCIFYDLWTFSFCSWQRGRKICVSVLHIWENSVLHTYVCYGNRLTCVCYGNIYMMDIDIWQCRGNLTLSAGANKNTWLYIICYNLFTAGGVLLQGEFSSTQVVIIKKGENVEAYQVERFWWWTSISTTLWLFYLCCKFWVFLCNFRLLWKALNTHTNTFISRLDFLV